MHAFTHTLAHRAPSSTRPRVRWQPYNPVSSQSSSIRSPSTTQSSTPSSSISSPPSNTLRESKFSHTLNQKETPPPRDSSKKQFAVGLVDQAVKTLGEIWCPQDIPLAFRAGAATGDSEEYLLSSCQTSTSTLSAPINRSDAQGSVPIKGFVHEVIRRSRTSGCVLQTALCYLEAIRPKISVLLRKEKSAGDVHGNIDISSCILPATEFRLETEHCLLEKPGARCPTAAYSMDSFSSVRLADIQAPDAPSGPSLKSLQNASHQVFCSPDHSGYTISTPPSPLLCPRRAFLASLILASKFMQDKCYSNRAWSKLSGFPARELSSCERALGDALNWRLWVGKTPVQNFLVNVSSSIGTAASNSRSVVRSQSESNVLSISATRSSFLARHDSRPPSSTSTNMNRVLHRSSTLPAEIFASFPLSRTSTSGRQNTQELLEKLAHTIAMPKQVSTVLSFADGFNQSPSPDVPGLSYSPSTESSSGDRTIQMSTFLDEPMVHSVPQVPTVPELWLRPDASDLRDFQISPLACPKTNQVGKALAVPSSLDLLAAPSVVAGIDLVTSTHALPASNLPWLLDGEPNSLVDITGHVNI